MIAALIIDHERMARRVRMLGLNALITSISHIVAEDIIELYRKHNRVEHCFRTINSTDLAFLIYHWTTQKIKVHMFLSLMAYLFLAVIYNEIRRYGDMSLTSTIEIMKDIMVVFTRRGRKVIEKLDFKSEMGEVVARIMNLEQGNERVVHPQWWLTKTSHSSYFAFIKNKIDVKSRYCKYYLLLLIIN